MIYETQRRVVHQVRIDTVLAIGVERGFKCVQLCQIVREEGKRPVGVCGKTGSVCRVVLNFLVTSSSRFV